MSSVNPFGCGPNPCEWPCREVTIPGRCPNCTQDPAPYTLVMRLSGWGNNACQSCVDEINGDYLIEGLDCIWQFNKATDCGILLITYRVLEGQPPLNINIGTNNYQFVYSTPAPLPIDCLATRDFTFFSLNPGTDPVHCTTGNAQLNPP